MESINTANNDENNDSTENTLSSKHRKERKELQAKIQSLKKSASKGDKKKRKEILGEIAKLEIDLEKKQAKELNDLNHAESIENIPNQNGEKDDNLEENPIGQQQQQQPRISKAQRRRDRKAKEEKEREAEIQENSNKSGPRMIESKTIKNLLKSRRLVLHSIPSDGNCLYNAIIHQLRLDHRMNHDVSSLRNATANYILENKDNLISYMTNNETGDWLTDDEFNKYCEAVRNTPAWGGQIEIKALSQILQAPIEIIQATGPPIIQGTEYIGSPLVITYHRHLYSLGEHYNSTRPWNQGYAEEGENDTEEDENHTEEHNDSN